MENSPTRSRTKRSKGKVVRAFFRTAWTTLKSTFIHHDPNRVVCLQPQPDLEDPELMHVSNKPRLDAYPELVCLPGQVCEDLESPCVSGFFRSEKTANTDPVIPELECLPGQVYEEDLESLCVSGVSRIEQTPDADPELVCEDLESLCVSGFSRIEQTPDADPELVCEDLESLCVSGFSRIEQTPDADLELICEDLESLCVSDISRIEQTPDADPVVPELVCLPGQVCEDPESLCVSGSSRIEQTPYIDPADSELSPASIPSSSDLDDEKPKKRRAVCAFFRRLCKAAKLLFHGQEPDSVQHLTPVSDLANSELMLAQVSSEIKSVPEPEPESVPEPEPVQVCEHLLSLMEVEPDGPEALPVGLQYGTRMSVFFQVREIIGTGAYGQVYEGTHIFNERIKVAIKHILKRGQYRYLDTPDHSKPVLAEVALMLRLGQAPSCPNIIKLYHWIEDQNSFILIMEKPHPCQTLRHYIIYSDDINEAKARWMIRQLVQAVKHCVDRGVFHGDIHSGNVLVVTDDSLTLKLIDFGCSRLITSEGFNSSEYRGANLFTPPEVLRDTVFYAEPAYVWAVGVVLFEILHRHLPFKNVNEILHVYLNTSLTLSTECRDLIFWCLMRDPAERLTLEQLEKHSWFEK